MILDKINIFLYFIWKIGDDTNQAYDDMIKSLIFFYSEM